MEQSLHLTNLKKETTKLIETVQQLMNEPIAALEYQKNSESWNVFQCIEHLNRYSQFYLKEFNKVLENGVSTANKKQYETGFLGKLFTTGMLPDENMKKMKAFKSKSPSSVGLNKDVLTQFIQDQKQLISTLEKAKKYDLNKNKCSITIPLLKMRLGDTLMFYVYHNIRHIAQAESAVSRVKA
ncbi:MAG: DinB family protein [Vicingaceae bacterium]